MRRKLSEIIRPTPEENEEINRGIGLDPDTWELTDEELKQLKPYAIYEEERRKAGDR